MKTSGLLAAAALALPLMAQPAAAQTSAVVSVDLVLRTGPDVYYPQVGMLPAGAPVTVYGCIEGWLWCDVAWGYERGWVAGHYLSVAYGPQPLPIAVYGPRYGLPLIVFSFGDYWDRHYRGRPWYAERKRWEGWDYKVKRWRVGYEPKNWDPKRGYYDPKRGDGDWKRGDDDRKWRVQERKGKPPEFDQKGKPAQYEPKGKPQDPNKTAKKEGKKKDGKHKED